MYEIIIIVSLALIFGILLRKWPETKLPTFEPPEPQLSDINYLKEAEELFKNKNFKEAERYYIKAVSKEPNNPLLYGRLGVIYTRQGSFKDAKDAFKMAVRLDPENGFYQNNLGSVLYNLKRYKEALLYFENAVDIDEKIAKRWLNLGLCCQKIGDLKKAKEAYQRALKLEPSNANYKELLKEVEEGLKKG